MSGKPISSGWKQVRKRDGKTRLCLTIRTDPDTFEEVRQYATKNRCSASQAVRELVEIGLDTLLEGENALQSAKGMRLSRIGDYTLRGSDGHRYLAVTYGSTVFKQSEYNASLFSAERNPHVANSIRGLLISDEEQEVCDSLISEIKSAVLFNVEWQLTNFTKTLSDRLSSSRKLKQRIA